VGELDRIGEQVLGVDPARTARGVVRVLLGDDEVEVPG
jgi:hypothetical protein